MKRTFTILATIALSACSPSNTATEAPNDVPFSTIEQASASQGGLPMAVVVEAEPKWISIYEKLAGTAKQRPAVNFDTHQVIAISSGNQPSGGFAVEIVAVGQVDGALQVTYEERRPGNACGNDSVITYPFHLIKVERQSLPIRYASRVIWEDCKPLATECSKATRELQKAVFAIGACNETADCVPDGHCGQRQINRHLDRSDLDQRLVDFHDSCGSHSCVKPPAELECIGGQCHEVPSAE